MSASSVSTQESSGRGRGRGAKKTSEPPRAAAARSSNRRRTVDAGPTPQGVLLRSNSNNSLNSEISSCSLNSQSRGRGGRQRGRGQRTETDSLINSQRDKNSAPKSPARGRKSRKADESCNAVPLEDEKEKADSQQASTTRGQRRANANGSKPAAADEDDSSYQEEGCATEELVPLKKNIRAKGQKAVKSKTVEASVAPAVNDGDEAKGKGRKRDLEPNTEEESSSSFKISKGTTEAAEAKTKDKVPVQAKRRGRASTSQAKKTSTEVEVKEESERMEEEIVERRGRGRPSAVQKKKIQEQEESGSSVDQDAHVESSEPQTPKSSGSRKRQATADFSPVAKTPRSSSASPAASGRLRTASQAYKVLFTGVVDEAGERVLARLGGCMAKGVADMKVLVTDKVRRTVKFLCAVAKGIPIVTTQWLEKSGKAGSFLPPNLFVVNDLEQEKKFNFCLQESLQIASSQPLLQGYEIHVTKSVKPEPVQMKDIITCSGATFLAKMPSSHKPRTVVISCEEDWFLCGPALTASLPVVTAEFILSGILQQKLDLQTNALSAPTSNLQPAGGRGRSRKKT
ncbi:Mediator of DNA damage checkpoint protein 1 [Larimichthys crocea]|uniref:Mediator of DNA damage checkpoint protein 1 n=1 Tax=Larimichthys crocea TaxID=215358 RepID=A0A6G0ICG5_LARCR|nr:Mediator of DNA damage checkpoint protein 1 [Larimichthys crocea]